MRLKPFYLSLAVFSAVFAIAMVMYLDPLVETGSVRDLMWITFLFLMLDAVFSVILAFVRDKAEKSPEQSLNSGSMGVKES